ncbi:unnamed protein product [Penicillium viridicatum]
MATNNRTDLQVGDTNPDSQITAIGQTPGLPIIKDIDANDIDSNGDKADTKTDLDGAQPNSKDPEAWALRVKFALAQLRLQHLINRSVPRPAKGQHNFNRWVKWSRTVARWLYLQVDEDIQEKLQHLRKIPSKADDLFAQIMDVVRESDKTINATTLKVRNYDSRKKSDFEFARKYIAAHQTPFHLLGSNLLPVSSSR